MKTSLLTLITTGLVMASSTLPAIDINHGKTLQQQNCMRCHDDNVYTREERRVTTLDALKHQVERCETNLNLTWFPEDVDAVTEYLNTSFYKFK
ncbi:MAG TPA: green heme protein [Gammaproteobacteria bacterium]|nr:green heme protein [Gammaproteobacteria bacterium]